jgi:hypothetical protein
VPLDDDRTADLLAQLRTTVTEMERLAIQARSLLTQLEGGSSPGDDVIERTRQAVQAVRAKVRAAQHASRRKAG